VPETSSQTTAPSLEQILWRAMDRFREEPALVDAEEFADHIAHAFDAQVSEERFSEHFFAGAGKLHRKSHTLAEAVVRSAKQRLHVYEFDLNQLEYVIVEDKDRLVVVSDFGQFQIQSDDALGRALEAAMVKAPERRGGEPRGYFVRASGEVVGIDVKKVARTLERAMLEQVSMPAVGAPAARLARFNPVRKALSESREERALRQDPRLSGPIPAAPAAALLRGGATAASRQTALFVVMPDGSLARAEIGSATRWEQMLGQYSRTAAQQVTIQAGNVLTIVGGLRQGTTGERAEARGEALAAVRAAAAPVRALAGHDLARALAGGARLVPAVREGEGFWIQPEQEFRPSHPLPEKTLVAQPLQLGEVTGDPWADWALMMGGGHMRRRGIVAGTAEEMPPAPALAQRVRDTRAVPLQIAGAPVVAFRAPDGSIILNRDTGPVRLASVDRPQTDELPDAPVALPDIPEIAPRVGAVPLRALQALHFALARTAASGSYRLPAVRIDSRPDAIEVGNALQLGPADDRRRSVRMKGPATTAERTTQVLVSMPFPNRGELHVGNDLSEALNAWVAAPVLPAPPPALQLRFRETGTSVAPGIGTFAAPAAHLDWRPLREEAARRAQQGVIALEMPAARSLARGDPAISDLPFLLRRAVAESGDWTPGPGTPAPLTIRDFAFRAPFVTGVEATSPAAVRPSPRHPSPGEEEIVIPLPLWAEMGRGTVSGTGRIMGSPFARRGHAARLGAYRLVVPGGGPIDLTGSAAAVAPRVVEISGPTGLRLEHAPVGRVVATTGGGRHFLGRVPIDETEAAGRRRYRVGAPRIAAELAAATLAPESPDSDIAMPPRPSLASHPPQAEDVIRTRSEPLLSTPGLPRTAADPVVSRGSPTTQPSVAGPRVFETAGRQSAIVRAQIASGASLPSPVHPLATASSSAPPALFAAPVGGLEPGMWSGHRPASTDRYRRWTYASWNKDEPQDVGGVPLSGTSRRTPPQLPVALRFRYVGAPLWWAHGAVAAAPDHASAQATRAMQAGLRAANSAAAIWRSILVAAAPPDDATGGMDAGREDSAEKMSSLARSFEALSRPLASATPLPAAAAPAYIAMSSAGAAGTISTATAARARAQAVEMSIVAAIPPAPPPLESMSTASRGADAPHTRGRGHAHDAAHGHHKEADDAVSHSKIEGSVDAIAQRIYHRIRRRIESDRERFGG
jgi:hypothetical protein